METQSPLDSFSQLHSYSYSVIALQELNLNYYYPPIYWNTACLTIDSQADEDNDKSKATQYGKVAKSIYKMIKFGANIVPPNINESEIGFTPNEERNEILFGLGGISGINQDIAKAIIDNRPYSSFKDFYDKFHYKGSLVTKAKFIKLIQAGCFDSLNPNRVNLMKWLCVYENPKKESLTTSNLSMAISLGVELPKELVNAYKLKQMICSKQYFYCNDNLHKSKKHYIVEPKYCLPYLENKFLDRMEEEKDYYYDGDKLIVIDKSLEKAMKKELEELKEYLNKKETIKQFNTKMLEQAYIDMIGVEDTNKWAFQATSFYHNGKHELDGVNLNDYNVSHFEDLPEEPRFIEKSYGKRTWKQYEISRICGTVLDRKDKDHLVDILTPDSEVVTLNIPQGMFGYYKQNIEIDGIKDENWLFRGNMIMASGYRKGESFFVKKYRNSIFQHSIALIRNVNEDKTLDVQLERLQEDEEND